MIPTKERYINFFTDFAFKRLFGREPSKELLLDFLNALLEKDTGPIASISYMKNEQVGRSEYDRHAVYDIHCQGENGESFIVEIQKTKQRYFKDRTIYYATFPITEQAIRGQWDFKLGPVYVIAILDFVFDDGNDPHKYIHNVALLDEDSHEKFYDKLKFVYLEMPKFTKKEEELETHFEKWLYAIKNLSRLDRVPSRLKEKVFEKFFLEAEIARLSHEENKEYEEYLNAFRDYNNCLNTAKEDGREEMRQEMQEKLDAARKEAKESYDKSTLDSARAMLRKGVAFENVCGWLELTEQQKTILRQELSL